MKISRGIHKGRNINVPEEIRPVSRKVKESCFNIVKDIVVDAAVLDLFAGSGALGLEAISCGAKSAVFVDYSKASLEIVSENIEALGLAAKARAIYGDALERVKDFKARGQTFDLIFLDPPYYQGILNKVLQRISEYDIVSDFGFLVAFCYESDEFANKYGAFSLILEKKYGQNRVLVYEKSDLSGNV